MNQAGCHAAADHPFTRYANQRDGIRVTARQPSPHTPDRSASPAVQVTENGRWIGQEPRKRQRFGGGNIESTNPLAVSVLASLGERVREEIELVDRGQELQAQGGETFVGNRRCGLRSRGRPEPGEELPQAPTQRTAGET